MGASYSFRTHADKRVTMVIEYTSADVTGEITFPNQAALTKAHEDPVCVNGRRHWNTYAWREWAQRHGGVIDALDGVEFHHVPGQPTKVIDLVPVTLTCEVPPCDRLLPAPGDVLDIIGGAQNVGKFISPGADKVDGWGDTRLEDIDAKSLNLSAAVWYAARAALDREPDGCGCVTFYTPKQWAERDEDYGLQSDLIIVHDGGDFAPLLNPIYECFELSDKFEETLRAILGAQILLEPCTGWYTSLTLHP